MAEKMSDQQLLFSLVSHYKGGKPKAEREAETKKAFALAKERGYKYAIGRYRTYIARRRTAIID